MKSSPKVITTLALILALALCVFSGVAMAQTPPKPANPGCVMISPDGMLKLPNGTTIPIADAKANSDGTYTLPGGKTLPVCPPPPPMQCAVVNTDGSVGLPGGTIVPASDVTKNTDGTVTLPDGNIFPVCPPPPEGTAGGPVDYGTPAATYVNTICLPEGTHRPEILFNKNKLYVVACNPAESVQHQGFVFDATDFSNINFSSYSTFDVNSLDRTTTLIGDHRAAIVNNELWVVYQVLNLKAEYQGKNLSPPAEQYAESQTLKLVRFSLDGTKIAEYSLLSTSDTGNTADTYPDMCVLPTRNNTMLLSTGTNNSTFKIREIDTTPSVLSAYEYTTTPPTGPGTIGNSMVYGTDGGLVMFSYYTAGNYDLTASKLDSSFAISSLSQISSSGYEDSFPTGVVYYKGHYFTGHISRAEGGDFSMETNPYYPYLKVLDENFSIISSAQVSTTAGFAHVHPTIAINNDVMYMAWSQHGTSSSTVPQVCIAKFTLSFTK